MSERSTLLDRLNPITAAERRGEERGSLETRKKIIEGQLPIVVSITDRLGELQRNLDEGHRIGFGSGERDKAEADEKFFSIMLRRLEQSLKIDVGDHLSGRYPGDRFEYTISSHYYNPDIEGISLGDLVEVVTVKIRDNGLWSQAAESGRFVVYQKGEIKLVMTGEELNKR